jgi:hypothetical protein
MAEPIGTFLQPSWKAHRNKNIMKRLNCNEITLVVAQSITFSLNVYLWQSHGIRD